MATVLGLNCKAYRAAALLTGQAEQDILDATWTEITNLKDATLNMETAEADITTRAANGWRLTAATLRNGAIDFQMQWDSGDTGFAAIKTAWLTNAEIGLMFLDGARTTAGSQGLAGNFRVTNFSRNEGLEDAVMVDVTVKLSSQPQWHVKTT